MAGDDRQIICTLDSVRKQYASQSFPVLNGISLSIAEGEIIGIRGENGSGKSTLLSVTGTRLTQWTPLSNFIRAKASGPVIIRSASLIPQGDPYQK